MKRSDMPAGGQPSRDLSLRPHLLRAIYEWCAKKKFTPMLTAEANRSDVRAPDAPGDSLVFNISSEAVRDLIISDDISFTARFQGKIFHVTVPMAAVTGIHARETGVGFSFSAIPESESVAVPASRRPSLRVI